MKKTKSKIKKYAKIEKILIILVIMFGIISPVLTVYSHATLSKSNIEVEKLKNKVNKQKSINKSLSMQLDELASLSNIQEIAKEYGLSYNNDNIIVITK